MLCPLCGGPMIPLFTSCVCDYCERPPLDGLHRGYVVWRGISTKSKNRQYVFPTRADAERWRAFRGLAEAEVREVFSREPFNFRSSRGSIKDLRLADKLFEIYPDHRFKPGPHRAFLAPSDS